MVHNFFVVDLLISGCLFTIPKFVEANKIHLLGKRKFKSLNKILQLITIRLMYKYSIII